MQCSQCQAENRKGRRFCAECAAPLAVACPACGFVNEPGEKFCGGCAHDLIQPADDTGSAAAPEAPGTPVVSPEPTEPADALPAEGERRHATVLFSDLSGYTAMNERLDPEEVEAIMSRVKGEAVRIVEAHGGIVSQFVGDEVLALFGIPTAHEDDPRRAVKAALELHEAARAVSPELEERIGRTLRMHTGVNSGLVVTNSRDIRDGTIGVTGDTVNTAARLKSRAEDDQILLSGETRRRITSYFHTEALSPVEMRGKAKAMTPYRVAGELAVETRFEAAAQRGLSPFVGRERERDMLWECFEQVEQGRGQAVAVIGEAGLGKTRLIYEFRTALDLDRVNQVRGRCAATGGNLSYLPFIDLLKRWFRIRETDSHAEMLKKTERSALSLDPGLEEHLPALLHLLSIPSERAFPPGMAGEAIQRKIVAALRACLTAGCRERPLVMVFEDLHWMDGGSEAVLQQYLEAIPAQRAMLVFSYRPEYRPPWGHYSHLTPLPLRPLPESGTAAIIAAALKTESLPEGLAPLVHRHTEGNPFYAEEVALSMEDEGLVRRDNGHALLTRPVTEITFPDSVQELVRARIDRLGDGAREVLRLASVVGREFTEGLVARLSGQGETVSAALGTLKTLEMILEKRFQPELEFMFKHAITHQVAYESLLLARRKSLHKLVGLGIEELYAERLPEFYEMLAHHFEQGDVWDKAVEYYTQAGIKTARNYSIATALANFARAQAILSEHKPGTPAELEYQLCISHGQTLIDHVRWVDALPVLERARIIGGQLGDLTLRVQSSLVLAQAQLYSHDFFKALDTIGEVEKYTVGVPELHVGVVAMRFMAHMVMGDVVAWKELTELEKRIAAATTSPLALPAQFFLGLGQRFRGNHQTAIQILEKILPTFKQVATTNRYLAVLFIHGVALGEAGRYQEAIELLEEGKATGLEAGELYTTPKVINSLGWAHHELGLYEQALEYNTAALNMVGTVAFEESTHRLEVVTMTTINLAENHQMMGQLGEARRLLQELYNMTEPMEFIWARERWKVRLLMVWGEIELTEGNRAAAQARLDEARSIKFLETAPFRKYQIRGGRLQGNIHAANEKFDDAEAELRLALKRAKQFGNPTQHWRTAQALGNLYAAQGKPKQAATQYRATLKLVQGIADGLTEPELKEGLLTSAMAREVFAQAEGS